MADPFASPDDVAARWRPLTPTEVDQATALLQDASVLIRAQYPGIDDQIVSGQLDSDAVLAVAANMVKRAMIGGATAEGASQVSQSAGPYSVSTSYANPTGNLFFTAADDMFIRGYQPAAKSVTYDTC
jgi:hypothetical protein